MATCNNTGGTYSVTAVVNSGGDFFDTSCSITVSENPDSTWKFAVSCGDNQWQATASCVDTDKIQWFWPGSSGSLRFDVTVTGTSPSRTLSGTINQVSGGMGGASITGSWTADEG